jgi:hypothetical protein
MPTLHVNAMVGKIFFGPKPICGISVFDVRAFPRSFTTKGLPETLRGFGFVTMASNEEAVAAKAKLEGYLLGGQALKATQWKAFAG